MRKAEEIKQLSSRINRMLPDNGKEAVTEMALCYANVAVATGCDDETAIGALKVALKQMRQGVWWKDS